MTNVFIKIGLVETAKWIFAEANSAVDVDHDHVSLWIFVLSYCHPRGSILEYGTENTASLKTGKPKLEIWKCRIFDLLPDCYTSSARTSRGRKFQRKKTISQRKNLPIECAQGDRPWCWCDLFWCHEVACGVRWSNVLGCEVAWGELLWLVATRHVMSCHLMCWSCHLMRCDCLCCVMPRDAMRCHVMCAHVKSCRHLLCPAMGWNVMRLNRQYSLNNYSVLQSTTPRLLCTSKYYSSTTPTLRCTTKYYSTTTLYVKVLVQYYSVLLCTTKYYSSTTK